jgi:hypothetical protein
LKLDCAGQCNGNAKLDGCGTCQGNEPPGSQCGYNFKISSGDKYENAVRGNIDFNSGGNGNQQGLYRTIEEVNIHNTNNTEVLVTLSLGNIPGVSNMPESYFGPEVTYQFLNNSIISDAFTVAPNSKFKFKVLISFATIISQTKTFAAKQIIFNLKWSPSPSLTPTPTPSPSPSSEPSIVNLVAATSTLTLPIETTVSSCSSVVSETQCVGLPGCVYCYGNNGMIFKDDDALTSTSSGTTRRRRRLFSNIMPHSTYKSETTILSGKCFDGAKRAANIACQSISANRNAYDDPSFQYMTTAYVICSVVVFIFLCVVLYQKRFRQVQAQQRVPGHA